MNELEFLSSNCTAVLLNHYLPEDRGQHKVSREGERDHGAAY